MGDEALLLARAAPTIVARDRAAGAGWPRTRRHRSGDGRRPPEFLAAQKPVLVVVDAETGFGNGFQIPAGPCASRWRKAWRAPMR
jgi:tetraacyldisaccharide 4'-kinase